MATVMSMSSIEGTARDFVDKYVKGVVEKIVEDESKEMILRAQAKIAKELGRLTVRLKNKLDLHSGRPRIEIEIVLVGENSQTSS